MTQPSRTGIRSKDGFDSRLKQAAEAVRSVVHVLSDEELLGKMGHRGIQVTQAGFKTWVDSNGSTGEVIHRLAAEGQLAANLTDEERLWISVAITELWKRWFPGLPSFEMLDERIMDGYERTDPQERCREWLEGWRMLLGLTERLGIQTLREFDERFRGPELIRNWVQELEIELGDLARPKQNREWFQHRLEVGQEFLSRFSRDDQYLIEHMRRGLAESVFGVGETERADELFRNGLAENPQWSWGWIGWGDCYLFAPEARRDLNRAEEIFQQGLAVEGIKDKDAFYERLEHLYEEQGRKDKSDEMRAALHRLKTGGPAVPAAPVQRASAKVGRNDPCPCGSGKKFKKCCGA